MRSPRRWLPCVDVARQLGKSVQTIYRWIDRDGVAGMRIARRRFIERESLETFLDDEEAVALLREEHP